MAFRFGKRIDYQKAIDFADRACQLGESFPRGYGFFVEQLNRATLSMDNSPSPIARIFSALPVAPSRKVCLY